MKKIVGFTVLENYVIRLRFDDGVEGEVDFSTHAGKGVFAPWRDYTFFRKPATGEGGRTLTWPGELDSCADALWLQVTGKKPEELFPQLGPGPKPSAHTPDRTIGIVRRGCFSEKT